MSFDLSQILSEMGVFALIIVAGLSILGLAALSVFGERLWIYRRARRRSREFAAIATQHLEAGDYAALERDALGRKHDVLARLVGGGVRTYRKAVADRAPGEVGPVELARRELGRKSDEVAAEIRRGLGVLASVGSIAPFVGLLGTVVGIIEAFEGIGAAGSAGIGAVSAGIAEALVVTAFGLTIAIPAVLMFNFLTAKSDGLLMALDSAKGQLLDHIEAHHVDDAEVAADRARGRRAARGGGMGAIGAA